MGAVSERAGAQDLEDPLFCRGELVTAAVLVEEGEAVDAHENVDADFFVREVTLEDAG